MIIYYLILIFFIILGLVNYKIAFLFYAAFRILLHSGICLKSTPPALTLEFALCTYFIFLYIAYNQIFKRKWIVNKEKFPLKNAFVLVFASYFLSGISSSASLSTTILAMLPVFICDYLFMIILWKMINKKEDVLLIIKVFTTIIVLSGLYGIYTFLTSSNPIIEFELSLLPEGDVGKLAMSKGERSNNAIKIQSFYAGATPFATYCSLFIVLIYICVIQYKNYIKISNGVVVALSILIIISVIISNSRSPLFAFLVVIIPFIFNKKTLTPKIIIPSILLLLISLTALAPHLETYFVNITSVFDYNSSEVTGSSVKMRIIQLSIAVNAFTQSPILGLGLRTMMDIIENDSDMMGAESIWFWLLVERGILGIISYIYVYICVIRKMSSPINKKYIIFITLSWITLNTMTTTPGLTIAFYFFIIILINRIDSIEKKNYWLHK